MAWAEISQALVLAVVVVYVLRRLCCEYGRKQQCLPHSPSEIHFTTSSITTDFIAPDGERISLKSLIDALLIYGDKLALSLDPIRIFYDTVDRKWRSLDNRRLYALKKAEECGKVSKVRCRVMNLDHPEVTEEYMTKKDCCRVTNRNPIVKIVKGFEWETSYNLHQS